MSVGLSLVREDGTEEPATVPGKTCLWRIGGDVYEAVVWTSAEWWAMPESDRLIRGKAQPLDESHWMLLQLKP